MDLMKFRPAKPYFNKLKLYLSIGLFLSISCDGGNIVCQIRKKEWGIPFEDESEMDQNAVVEEEDGEELFGDNLEQ
jgi:hypothetical protein